MSRSLGSLTLDLIVEFGGFIEGWDKSERETQKRSKQLRKEFKELGDDIEKWSKRAILAITAATTAIIVQTVRASKEISNLSAIANASAEEFQKYAVGAKQAGVEQEKLADIFQDTNKSIGEFLRTGAGPMKDFFEKIGPKIGVTAEQFKNLSGPQALQFFFDSLQKANLSQKEMVFNLERISNGSSKLIPLLKDGGQGFKLFGDEAQKAGGILSTKTLNASDRIAAAFFIAQNSAKGFKNQLAEGLLPTIRDLTGLFVGLSENQFVAAGTAEALANSLKFVIASLVGVVGAVDLTGKGIATLLASLRSKSGMEAAVKGFSEQVDEYATLLNGIWDAGKGKEGEMSARIETLAEMFRKLRMEAGSAVVGDDQNALLQQNIEKRLEMLREASVSEMEILQRKRDSEFAFLLQTFDDKTSQFEFMRQKGLELTTEQLEEEARIMEEYRALDLASEERYQKALADIKQREQITQRQRLMTALGTISTLMNSENKKAFQAGKIAAIAQSTINMFQGVGEALKLPWPLNFIVAPLVAAAGIANIQAIRNTQFGGGGSAGVSNTQAVNANATPTAPPGQQAQQTIMVEGIRPDSLFTGEQLLSILNEQARNGGRFVIPQNATYV